MHKRGSVDRYRMPSSSVRQPHAGGREEGVRTHPRFETSSVEEASTEGGAPAPLTGIRKRRDRPGEKSTEGGPKKRRGRKKSIHLSDGAGPLIHKQNHSRAIEGRLGGGSGARRSRGLGAKNRQERKDLRGQGESKNRVKTANAISRT